MTFSISEQLKREICIYYQENFQEIANYFSEKISLNIDRSSVTKILHDKEKWLDVSSTSHHNTFHHRKVRFPELEKAMNIWIGQVSASGLIITDNLVAEKAKNFGEKLGIEKTELTFSNGWLRGFKQRNNLKAVKIHGEANNETGLFYYMSPNQTLASGPILGKKKNKDRLTVLLATNATGTRKLKPLVIGKLAKPRCFNNVNMSLLPVIYKSTPKAWMRTDIFEKWLRDLDTVNYKQLYVHNLIKKFELRQNLEKKLNIKEEVDYIGEA
ncbi:1794_t:CDS:2 [Entrophospora sp. SA101]|nr:1794_t:CDS:2 [Entrophospora sp. SA101]